MAHWIDNADSWICSMCGYESNNPNKEKYGSKRCPSCGEVMKSEDVKIVPFLIIDILVAPSLTD